MKPNRQSIKLLTGLYKHVKFTKGRRIFLACTYG